MNPPDLGALIERASRHADKNLSNRRQPYPLAIAILPNGSYSSFLIPAKPSEKRASFLRNALRSREAIAYVLTLAAVHNGKQFVLFLAENTNEMKAGRREILSTPHPHVGNLEMIDANIYEGQFVGLLSKPHSERSKIAAPQ